MLVHEICRPCAVVGVLRLPGTGPPLRTNLAIAFTAMTSLALRTRLPGDAQVTPSMCGNLHYQSQTANVEH